MLSSRFVVNSNALFLCGTTDGTVTVMDTGTDLNSASYSSNNWKIVATVIGTFNKLTGIPTGKNVYRGLEIFGTVIEGPGLDILRGELFDLQNLVNRDGYQVKYFGTKGWYDGKAAGFVIGGSSMVKLNNLFGWGKHGVNRPEGTVETKTVWNRYEVGKVGAAVVNYVAAEEREKEVAAEVEKQRKKLGEWMLRAAEKEEILGHYKRILEEKKKEGGEERRLREVVDEKNRVIEEQSRVIKEKEMEIQSLKLMMVKLNKDERVEEVKREDGDGDQEFKKAVMDSLLSCYSRRDLKGAVVFF